MAGNENSGGARDGAGRKDAPRPKVTKPAAIYIRELTRNRLKRKDVTKEEIDATLEMIIQEYAKQHEVEESPDQE